MIALVPLTLIPLLVFNVITFGFFGEIPGEIWVQTIFTVEMVSGARWTMILGDLMICVGIVFLFAELWKATRIGRFSSLDHILSMLVFVAYLVEFIIIREAAHSVFFILMAIAFVDTVAGILISISVARRDVAFTGTGEPLI